MQINMPEIIEELEAVFISYETALMQNNVDALIAFFWNSPCAIRFGANETLYGWQAIVEFRQQRPPSPPRTLFNTVITTFGTDYANANTEFISANAQGRQSQSWIRTTEGWKIAAAHISFTTK